MGMLDRAFAAAFLLGLVCLLMAVISSLWGFAGFVLCFVALLGLNRPHNPAASGDGQE